MASLYNVYKKIAKKYNSISNLNSLSKQRHKNNSQTIISSFRKSKDYRRNQYKNLNCFYRENMNDNEQMKQKSYFTFYNKSSSESKFHSINQGDDSKTNSLKIKYPKVNSKIKRYNDYYIASNLLKNKYISDLVDDKQSQQIMEKTDDKIDDMIKYLNIYQNIKLEKIKKLPKSMTQRIILDSKPTTNTTNDKNIKEKDKIRLITKKCSANLLSPSKQISKDMYLYKKIFYYSDKKKTIRTEKELDNKLNIIYSENEHQYQKNLNKLNQIYKTLGKKKIYNIEPSQSENKVKNLQKRVEFMKRVVDYTYPDMVLTKIKEQDKTIFEKSVVPVNIITSKVKRKKDKMFNNRISQGLVKSINIQKCIFKGLNGNRGFET
jgi:hypothetical protein